MKRIVPFAIVLLVSGSMPDGCWSVGEVGDYSFGLVDVSGPGISCITVLIPFDLVFDLGELMTRHYTITLTETHTSLYDPGSWQHVMEFTVGDPPIAGPESSWGLIKALYR